MNRMVLLLIVAVAAGIAGVLFQVKYRVQDVEQEIAGLNAQIRADREAMHVLRTEWSYLNQPERIAELAERHLEMGLMEPLQVVASFEVLPPRPEDFGYAQADLDKVLPEPRQRPATPAGWGRELQMASAEPARNAASSVRISRAEAGRQQASAAPSSGAPSSGVQASAAPAEPEDNIGDKIAQLMGEAPTPVLEEEPYQAVPRALPISATSGVRR